MNSIFAQALAALMIGLDVGSREYIGGRSHCSRDDADCMWSPLVLSFLTWQSHVIVVQTSTCQRKSIH